MPSNDERQGELGRIKSKYREHLLHHEELAELDLNDVGVYLRRLPGLFIGKLDGVCIKDGDRQGAGYIIILKSEA